MDSREISERAARRIWNHANIGGTSERERSCIAYWAKIILEERAIAESQAWISVEEKLPDDYEKVDSWFDVAASPRSFGISDRWRETECWREDGKWFHYDKMRQSAKRELETGYITHWMPLPNPPKG